MKNEKLGKILFRSYLASLAVLIIGGLTTVTVTSKHFALKEQEAQLRNNILQYTEKMEVIDYGETDEGKDFEYFGQATIGIPDEIEAIIIVTRFNYTESVKLLNITLFGELTYDEILKTDIFELDEMIFMSYDTETKDGYQVSLEAVAPIEIVFDDYVSSLRSQIDYKDINDAMNLLIDAQQ